MAHIEGHLGLSGERPGPDARGVLHRPAGRSKRRQPRTPSPATGTPSGSCSASPRAHPEGPLRARLGRPRRPARRRVLGAPRKGATTASAPATTAWRRCIRSSVRGAPRHPEHAASIQRVLAIQPKHHHRNPELPDRGRVGALLAACDASTWTGRRDHAIFLLAAQSGLRGLRAHRLGQRRPRAREGLPTCTAWGRAGRKGARHYSQAPFR